MVEVNSTMLPLGTKMPPFDLPDSDGRIVASSDYEGAAATLVMFICNHCPYVRHVRPALARLAVEYRDRGVAVIAINSNDVAAYPQDGPDGIRDEAKQAGYPSLTFSMSPSKSPRHTVPPAHRTSTCSTPAVASPIEANSTTPDPAAAGSRLERISVEPSTTC